MQQAHIWYLLFAFAQRAAALVSPPVLQAPVAAAEQPHSDAP